MQPSALTGFLALAGVAFRRQWRVRSLGWVALALVALMAAVVGVVSNTPAGWRLETQTRRVADFKNPDTVVRMTYEYYGVERLSNYQFLPGSPLDFGIRSAVFAPFRAATHDRKYLDDWAFMNFSRWVVFSLYLGFLLPLFCLAFATAAVGGEREDRTLIWLTTRPLPRAAIYLAKFLGVLPWCAFAALAGFAAVCLPAGDLGERAFLLYWPAVLAGSVGFSALFTLIGAVVRRPAVVGLVYVFFFEVLVTNLPGSLKRLSLNYYTRSAVYNEAVLAAPAVSPETLEVYEPVSAVTAYAVLLTAAVVLTVLGAFLFARLEPKDDV